MATEGSVGTSSVPRGLLRIPGTTMVINSQNRLKIAVVRLLLLCCCTRTRRVGGRTAGMYLADGTQDGPQSTQQGTKLLYVDARPACYATAVLCSRVRVMYTTTCQHEPLRCRAMCDDYVRLCMQKVCDTCAVASSTQLFTPLSTEAAAAAAVSPPLLHARSKRCGSSYAVWLILVAFPAPTAALGGKTLAQQTTT